MPNTSFPDREGPIVTTFAAAALLNRCIGPLITISWAAQSRRRNLAHFHETNVFDKTFVRGHLIFLTLAKIEPLSTCRAARRPSDGNQVSMFGRFVAKAQWLAQLSTCVCTTCKYHLVSHASYILTTVSNPTPWRCGYRYAIGLLEESNLPIIIIAFPLQPPG